MVIYRVDYEQRKINVQTTVYKDTWKVKANAAQVEQIKKKYKNKIIK